MKKLLFLLILFPNFLDCGRHVDPNSKRSSFMKLIEGLKKANLKSIEEVKKHMPDLDLKLTHIFKDNNQKRIRFCPMNMIASLISESEEQEVKPEKREKLKEIEKLLLQWQYEGDSRFLEGQKEIDTIQWLQAKLYLEAENDNEEQLQLLCNQYQEVITQQLKSQDPSWYVVTATKTNGRILSQAHHPFECRNFIATRVENFLNSCLSYSHLGSDNECERGRKFFPGDMDILPEEPWVKKRCIRTVEYD